MADATHNSYSTCNVQQTADGDVSWERETPEKKKETTTVLLNENDVLWPKFRHIFIADCMEKVLTLPPTQPASVPPRGGSVSQCTFAAQGAIE